MVPFNDLRPRYADQHADLDAAIRRVLARGRFVLGPELECFEQEFADYHGGGHAVGVASGTDAIELALRAAGIGLGDEVVTVSHTAVATVCGIERAGATPVFADIDPVSCTMAADAADAAVTPRTRALVAVHLYGHPANLPALFAMARRHGLLLIEDCAQAHGAKLSGWLVGTWGDLAAFSFCPAKNLGALGDGGAVLVRDPVLAGRLRRLRNHGQAERCHHAERGINSRLDEIQAAILRIQLAGLDAHGAERRRLAALYSELLPDMGQPRCWPGPDRVKHANHRYVIRHPRRDALRQRLRSAGVETLVHYPVPVHLQPAYADLDYVRGSLPATERAAAEVLSLPLYVGLRDSQVHRVADAVRAARKEAA
jgi:dTDP-3-amino-3,4,6-trideoxy-alpha-D-glucose transaminase